MPALKGIDEKYVNGVKVDKENDDVIYNDEKHLYLSKKDGGKYVSCTTLIHSYTQPFDSNFWSSYKACEAILGDSFKFLKSKLLSNKIWKDSYLDEYNVDRKEFKTKKAEILQSYSDKNKEACEHGTAEHEKRENMFYQKDEKRIKSLGFGGQINVKKGTQKFNEWQTIYPEILLSYEVDQYLRVCGQADCVFLKDKDITIIDWKTSKSIDKDSYYDKVAKKKQMMLHPLENLPDSNFWHYSMQLSLYMYMIQRANPKFKCKKLMIVHIDRNNKETEYECPYLKEEVERMLIDYRRKNKIKSELEQDKPIIW